MNAKIKTALVITLVSALSYLLYTLAEGHELPLLFPQGVIAIKERNLIVIATLLMLIVVIPVFLLTAFFAWRYRAGNTKAKYTPNWEHGRAIEFVWWSIPFAIVLILGVITWRTTHELDPFQPIDNGKAPLTVEVVALNWKWLFIYPEEGIASVNQLVFPAGRPVALKITADAPMNSFWIPSLAGQVYAMPGMVTELHLLSWNSGSYKGLSANFSGEGFSGMKFTTLVTSQSAYDAWVMSARNSPMPLTLDEYAELVRPSMNVPVSYYKAVPANLYNDIVMKYSGSVAGKGSSVPATPETGHDTDSSM